MKSVAIIGAGIGGLSAGSYAQMNGFNSEIFEMHNLPGGQCTSWKRGGFTFDGCIHHLAGCQERRLLYRMWEELGALPRKIIFPEHMCQVEDEKGKPFTVYVNLEKLEQHMIELAPGDTSVIKSYINGCRSFIDTDMLETPLLSGRGFAKRFFKMTGIMKWNVPMKKFAEKFQDPFLRKTFPTIQYDWTDTPTFLHLNMMGNCHTKNYGVPEGASLSFSKSIERRYLQLGGTVHYNCRVEKILVENDKAVGIRLSDGTEHRAHILISDAFGYSTIFNLLDGRYVDNKVRAQYAKPLDNMVMGLQVSFGLSMDLSKEPRALVLFLGKPIQVADRKHEKLDVELFGFDPTIAPKGKSVLRVLLNTSYQFWQETHRIPEKYKAEKELVTRTLLQTLEKRFPGIQSHVDTMDVATPMTMERFTGVGRGYNLDLGFFGGLSFIRGIPKTLPGLKNFHLVGSSVGGAGIPGCAAQARNAIKKICNQEGITFRSGAD